MLLVTEITKTLILVLFTCIKWQCSTLHLLLTLVTPLYLLTQLSLPILHSYIIMSMVIRTLLLFWWFIHCANNSIFSISIDLAWEYLVEQAEVRAKALACIFSALALMVCNVLSEFHGTCYYWCPFFPVIMVQHFRFHFNYYIFPCFLGSTFLWHGGRTLGCYSKGKNVVNAKRELGWDWW